MTEKEFFVPFELHSPSDSLRNGLNSFCDTVLRCNFLEWNGAAKCRKRGRAKRGSSSVGEYRDRVLRAQGAASCFGAKLPAEGTAPPCAVAPRVVAHFFAPKTTHPFRQAAGFKIIEFILSTKKVDNKEIPFAVTRLATYREHRTPDSD
ncbi:hypothetical protein SAMN05216428_103180 [Nitrosospira sp. Nsp11]|uniref:hypothetical protein n=1 Tax=Nitrosospira sp. Nsp11 TaxID=1855338 RepID=UPI0009144208|nr:hypothetical protein [Nitrosospira sp. Nsp11]SHL54994.1 hypothetical protein SAMN05216428_103180 [Nitrosospira sp. Nsp11]